MTQQRYTTRMCRLISFAFLAVLASSPVYAQDQSRGRLERVRDRGAHEILIADRHWVLLGEGYHLTADSTVDKVGNVYFTASGAVAGSGLRVGPNQSIAVIPTLSLPR